LSLTISFSIGTTSDGILYIADGTGAGSDLLDAHSGGALTLGGSSGESAAQLVSDLQGLQVKDSAKEFAQFGNFSISFTLKDVTTSASSSWSESFFTACYVPGTRIATPSGEMAVEDLQIGDLVATASGVAKPVKWIGRRGYSAAAVAEFANLRPVLIRAGALAPGLPRRDLMVSPMHALFIDEVFIPAAALVNGVSILRREAAGAADYIHIELADHDVVFAEGAPAETFVDDNSRAMFENVSEYYDLYGNAAAPRGFCATRLEQGYRLDAVRRRLAARAGVAAAAAMSGELSGHVERVQDGMLEGWVMDSACPAAPVELEVLVDGAIVATLLANRYRPDLDRAGLAGGNCAFTVAMPADVTAHARIEVRRAADGRSLPMPQPARVLALT
jgi:hypothetical protein